MCQVAPVDKMEHYNFLIKKFLYNLFTKKENTLHKQHTQQRREYQEKQGHNIDEEYCNSYGRRSLWSKK